MAERLRTGIVPHHNKDRILPGQRTHNAVDVHVIQRLAGAAGQTSQRFKYHDILGRLHAGNTLMENRPQLIGDIEMSFKR